MWTVARFLPAVSDVPVVPEKARVARLIAGRGQGKLVEDRFEMSQTDPIAELLTRIRNAMRARHNQIALAHSRVREAVCRVLLAEGFLAGVETGGEGYKKKLILALRYSTAGESVIRGLERISKPSIRRYAGAKMMPRVSGGMGLHVVSTPLGVITDREARRRNVGGEILLKVW
jgi:small subunit ribosomal protein S8